MATNSEEIEQSLARQIDPWLEHMRWRADYDRWRSKRIWQENYQAESLADFRRISQGLSPDARALDLGAGMGGFAVALARESGRVVALDYNPAYCEITRTRARRYQIDLPALVGAGEALPFASQSFAILTCFDVFEHVQDPGRLLSEIARVLKPDGRVILTVINRYALVDPHYHLRFVNWLPRPLGERYIAARQRTKVTQLRDRQKLSEMHYYTFGQFVREAGKLGFDVTDLNAPHSRLRRLSSPVGQVLYRGWRAVGMGTFRLALTRKPEPAGTK